MARQPDNTEKIVTDVSEHCLERYGATVESISYQTIEAERPIWQRDWLTGGEYENDLNDGEFE